jgi:hypothetical protein
VFLVAAAVTLLASCPNPIPVALASQISDAEGPVISITSPQDGGTYRSVVTVTGTVLDSGGAAQSLRVDVPSLELSETVQISEGGGFSHSFSTIGHTTSLTITLTATDWNGNEASRTVTLENDLTGPYIEIAEPADYSAYSTVVRVSGTVTDSAGVSSTDEVSACTYRIPGTGVAGDLELGGIGSFSFEFATRLGDGTQVVDGSVTIEIVATDWNGNTTVADVTVVKSATGDFPSMTVTAGDEQVTISWEPVLHAESYRIHNPRFGEIREDVTSPYVWDALPNGELCSFQIQAVVPDILGDDAWSSIQDAIPLSERNLAPCVRETGFRSITIEWDAIPASPEYLVERSVDGGPWAIRTITQSSTLKDSGLAVEHWYSYRVRPVDQIEVDSTPIAAVPGRFPPGGAGRVGGCATALGAWDVAIAGSYAYMADGTAGLTIVNIADPAHPFVVATIATGDHTSSVAVAGSYAYVAVRSNLKIIDVSNPAAPSIEGTYPAGADVMDVTVVGPYAYLAAGGLLQVVDVSVPGSPSFEGSTAANIVSVTVAGSYAYGASFSEGMRIIDISSPETPSPVGVYNSGQTYDVAVSGTYAYALNNSSMVVIDVSEPDDPQPAGSCTAGHYGIQISGSYAYVAASSQGLQVIDVSNPVAPSLRSTYDTPDWTRGVAVSGSYAYLADGANGLQVIDISNPYTPSSAGSHISPGYTAHAVAVSGTYAYVASESFGPFGSLEVLDVSNPAAPDSEGDAFTSGHAYGAAVVGSYAYVASEGGLEVFDITNLASPVLTGAYDAGHIAYDVAIRGPYAYVAHGNNGLQIVDISDPAEPSPTGSVGTTGYASGVDISGAYAYLGEPTSTLRVVDISDPADPVLAGEYVPGDPPPPPTAAPYDVVISGSYAYAADGTGLKIIDVFVPGNPTFAGSYDTPGWATGVAVSGSYAYVADGAEGLKVIDVSNPAVPVLVGSVSTGGEAEDVAIIGSYAYVACGMGGLKIVRLWEEP